jgi:hypothetical protein
VRLTYRDGCTAEGIWQDRTLIRGDGIVHSHTSGQVRREVIDQAEEWRPDAAVTGWAAGCSCGWRGTPWTRVPPEQADPAARRLTVTGPWADLAPTDDTRLLTARLRATPPGTDCVLSNVEEAAHARTADRMNHMWAHGSGIDRYLY